MISDTTIVLKAGSIVGNLQRFYSTDPAWSVDFTDSNGSVEISVTGDTSNDVEWEAFVLPILPDHTDMRKWKITTTDDTQTIVGSILVPDESDTIIKGVVTGFDPTSGDVLGMEFFCLVDITAGVGTIPSGLNKNTAQEDVDWDVDVTISGKNINIAVTGDTTNTVEWSLEVLPITVSE
jgi:hypothetical protein